MNGRRRLLVLLGLAGAVSFCLAASAFATVPGQNGKIAFVGTSPNEDIWTVDPNGANLTQLTTNGYQDAWPAWSPDGAKIVYSSRSASQSAAFLWTMNADGSDKQQLTFDNGGPFHDDVDAVWSPDGSKIIFVRNFRQDSPPCSELYVVNVDGTDVHQLGTTPLCHEQDLTWSPDGSRIAYVSWTDSSSNRPLFIANADNSNPVQRLPYGLSPSWAPGGGWIAAAAGSNTYLLSPDSMAGVGLGPGTSPEWSPDGKRIADDGIVTYDAAGRDRKHVVTTPGSSGDPAWQPLPPPPADPGYPRPRGAGPLVVSLVPAFNRCDTPNSVHGAPLAFGSCSPPVSSSSFLTIGTPDANGAQANSIGTVRLEVVPGDPSTPADEADVSLRAKITDVRCKQLTTCATGPLPDYLGDLDVLMDLQVTDRANGGSGNDPATFTTLWPRPAFHFPVRCAPTADTSIGASCEATTSLKTLVPGAVREQKRSIWELGEVRVFDGGDDGDVFSDGNGLFAVQGVFVP